MTETFNAERLFAKSAVALPTFMVKLGTSKAHGDKMFASINNRRRTVLHEPLQGHLDMYVITFEDGAVFLSGEDDLSTGLNFDHFTIPAFNGETQTFHWLVCSNDRSDKRVIILDSLQDALIALASIRLAMVAEQMTVA